MSTDFNYFLVLLQNIKITCISGSFESLRNKTASPTEIQIYMTIRIKEQLFFKRKGFLKLSMRTYYAVCNSLLHLAFSPPLSMICESYRVPEGCVLVSFPPRPCSAHALVKQNFLPPCGYTEHSSVCEGPWVFLYKGDKIQALSKVVVFLSYRSHL